MKRQFLVGSILMMLVLVVLTGCATTREKQTSPPLVQDTPSQPEPAEEKMTGKRAFQIIMTEMEKGFFRGMTVEQVETYSYLQEWTKDFGGVSKKNVSVGSWGRHEQWVYGGGWLYLYFENGKLSGWQW